MRIRFSLFAKLFLFHFVTLLALAVTVTLLSMHWGRQEARNAIVREAENALGLLKTAAFGGLDSLDVPAAHAMLDGVSRFQNVRCIGVFNGNGELVLERNWQRSGWTNQRTFNVQTDPGVRWTSEMASLLELHRDSQGRLQGAIFVGMSVQSLAAGSFSLLGSQLLPALVCVVLLAGGSYLFSRRMIHPLKTIIERTARVSRGDLVTEVKFDSSDEFGMLASTFNKMLEDLRNTTFSKDFVNNILRSMREALVVVSMDGKIVTVNNAICKVLGCAARDLVGMPFRRMLAQPETELPTQQFQTMKSLVQNVELELKTKNGRRIPFYFSVAILKSDKLAEGFVWVGHDITEQRMADRALKQAKEEAEATARSKAEFLANMSHEIRTPLNAIVGMTRLLVATSLDGEQRDFTQTIQTSSEALLEIIDDLLNYSKIEAGKYELNTQPFSVQDCVEEAIDLLSGKAAEKHLELGYLLHSSVPTSVQGDPTCVRQILVNLISNAVKFTVRGEVVLSIRARTTSTRETEVAFHIEDSGIGIPEDRINRLFKSFTQADATTKQRFGGTGLGLAICKRLCELMGGGISVQSEVGVGTTFRFTIRVKEAPQPPSPLRGKVPELMDKSLLVASKSRVNREMVRRLAELWGMRVTACNSSGSALKKAKHETFDFAVLDSRLSPVSGRPLIARMLGLVKEAKPALLQLCFKGRKSGRHQADAVLTKPIKPSMLYGTLLSIVEGKPLQDGPRLARNFEEGMAERHPLRILIAEDNVVNQKVALRLLEQLGYNGTIARSGLEALEALERKSYDLVLMDIRMPEMDGIETTRQICRRWPRTRRPRIIAMTANAQSSDRELCLQAGMDGYISKPFKFEVLVEALENTTQLKSEEAQIQTSPVDMETLVRFRKSLGSFEMFRELVETFLEDTPELLRKMHEGIEGGDSRLVYRSAHSLKSNCAMFGAQRMSEMARDLEALGENAKLEEVVSRLPALEAAFEEVRGVLAAAGGEG